MRLPRLTLNQKLAAVALTLGAVALFSQPHRGPFVKLDARELAMVVEQEVDHVTPAELAGWIVEGRADYRLLDLRSAAEYATYHIPTAENVTLSALPDYPLLRNEKIVLYSGAASTPPRAGCCCGRRATRACTRSWAGSTAGGRGAVPGATRRRRSSDRARFERAAALATFFGGQARAGTDGAAPAAVELPRLTAPPPTPGAAAPVAKRKKKEGC